LRELAKEPELAKGDYPQSTSGLREFVKKGL
jgi:hypothetical protein